jgi:hypothetical protein
LHLVGSLFYIIYDAWSHEHQMYCNYLDEGLIPFQVGLFCLDTLIPRDFPLLEAPVMGYLAATTLDNTILFTRHIYFYTLLLQTLIYMQH